ncbi:MAG: BTAD domain-containing putative transcriptional regulator [Streptosporangiaceae bacterium]
MISVRVLGPLEVTVDGERADTGGPRQRCVLARLVAEHGRVVSADRLIDDLYSDEAPPRALAAVQAYVSHLRRALEPGRSARTPSQLLVTTPPGYALRLSTDAVDAWSFEQKVHEAARLDDPAALQALLTSALAAWRGTAFQEFAGMEWADLETVRLEELRLAATERLAETALRLGRAAQLVADLNRLATEHPLREEAWRLLALALYQSGRQGDALAALRRVRAHLAADLGVDPSPALRKLEGDILAQDPHLSFPQTTAQQAVPAPVPVRSSCAAADSARPASTSPPDLYVGRDAEVTEVMRAAADSAAGRMRIVLVTGDAGEGKTALAGQVGSRLAEQGWIVAVGRCPEDEGAPAGWAWAQALHELAGSVAPVEPESLAPLLADAPAPDSDMPAARFRLHRAVATYLREVSNVAPLLVVLDDLHRADAETLAILNHGAPDLATTRFLVLATCRPAEVGEHLSAGLATLAAREPVRITLGGLDEAAATDLIRATCERAVDVDTARIIAQRTGGNPFFIREAARLLDSEGALAATSGVPAGVREVLQRRIARLPATAQTILQQAAVIGSETSVDVLTDVADVAEDVFTDAIEAGLVTGLVTEPDAGRVRFTHELVRDTLYSGLSRLRRSRIHARVAQAIERHAPSEVAALARHFTEAGSQPENAARYSRLAAEQAEQRFAYHEAARLYEQSIACLDQTHEVSARDRLDRVLRLVRALAEAGQLAKARSFRQAAVRSAEPLADPVLLAQVITAFDVPTLWPTQEYGASDRELVDVAEQTLTCLPSSEELLRCRLLVTIAFELEGAQSDRGYHAAAEAVGIARRLGDPDVLTIALNGRDIQSFRHDGLEERLRMGAELLVLPGKPVTTEALAHLMLLRACSAVADFDTADEHAAEAARIGDRYGLPVVTSRVSFYRAMRVGLDGDVAAADALYEHAAAAMGTLGMWRHGAGLSILGRLCARIAVGRASELAPELESFYSYPPWSALFRELYALALADAGETAHAREVAARPLPIRRDALWLLMTGIRGVLGIMLDDDERADTTYHALVPFAARPAGADSGVATLGPVAQILGDLGRHLNLPGADAHFEQAQAVARKANAQLWADVARAAIADASEG